MTSGRLWWAAPLGLAVTTGLVAAAFVLPGVANGTAVPNRLVIHRTPAAAPAAQSGSPSPTTRTTPRAHVVTPEHPVVVERDDNGGSRETSSADNGGG